MVKIARRVIIAVALLCGVLAGSPPSPAAAAGATTTTVRSSHASALLNRSGLSRDLREMSHALAAFPPSPRPPAVALLRRAAPLRCPPTCIVDRNPLPPPTEP